ncbi:hypothetical protein SAMN05421721_10829 [Ectothiorhodospira mobilis]|uniref:Uncharacterized protein n=2 Tax=Ectothiorhodospira mobilis TaxID=195064 RepID=A0A1I4RJF9_ECTMO|nr:hypothetical protein SAMN05421721_10829 [Ectothiorhodospira mobilis]
MKPAAVDVFTLWKPLGMGYHPVYGKHPVHPLIRQRCPMYAVEFEADIRDGVVRIPDRYARLHNAHARVVLLLEEPDTDTEVKAFSEHTAHAIEEWRAPDEDDVWT